MVTWNDELLIQIPDMDQQHEVLVNLVNQCQACTQAGDKSIFLDSALPNLITEVRAHFESEEGLMAAYQYPDLPIQRLIHQNLMAQVEHLYHRIAASEIFINKSVLDFLTEWLVDHIRVDDMRFGIYFNNHPGG